MSRNFVKVLFVFALLLGMVAQPIASSAAAEKNVFYVSLGDSLAAGLSPYGEIGKGYPDFIAENFKSNEVLQMFVRDYAVPGYTTTNVLDDIANNVIKGENDGIQAVLSQATHVTLDVGANDILKKIKIDPVNQNVSFDQEEVKQTFAEIQQNLVKITTAVKSLNPDVKLYIMGYYNPYPHLPAEHQPALNQLLTALNSMIEQIAIQSVSTYVPTADVIAKNIAFLPNPKDIHLSEDGYKAVSELFWNVMKPAVPEEEEEVEVPAKETPLVYWDGVILKKGQIGRLSIKKPINLWKRTDEGLQFVRVLNPGEKYRVYRYDNEFGGQYSVGDGHYVTKIEGYVSYKTPSKQKLELLK
ncbi:GDSL-type esterase/lipase family protein [Bacillus sp. JJ1773]|uniref:SGNH/GDSL hydrolase family protein n=1 Tax=Bacillus sp. JJ1773 TaxID=3122965 RepID=UPI0030007446